MAPLTATPFTMDSEKPSYPEFVGVILAATSGARLYPLTTATGFDYDDDEGEETTTVRYEMRKHLLPVMGVPIIVHLLHRLAACNFELCYLALGSADSITVPAILATPGITSTTTTATTIVVGKKHTHENDGVVSYRGMTIVIRVLPETCGGSGEAISLLSIPEGSHAVVLPADLILHPRALASLADSHRRGYRPTTDTTNTTEHRVSFGGVTVLLTNVGEEDDNGLPLKETAKAKKLLFARDDEDVEFIGLSSSSSVAHAPRRILLKQSKYHVEEDLHNTGSTPKLHIPEARLCLHNSANDTFSANMSIRVDWNDVHVYVLAPWVVKLLQLRQGGVKDIQTELLPMLIARQFKGVRAAFGSAVNKNMEKRQAMEEMLARFPFAVSKRYRFTGFSGGVEYGYDSNDDDDEEEGAENNGAANNASVSRAETTSRDSDGKRCSDDNVPATELVVPYTVTAQVLSRAESRITVRACTISAYLYACREAVAQAILDSDEGSSGAAAVEGNNTSVTGKHHHPHHGDKKKDWRSGHEEEDDMDHVTFFIPKGAQIHKKLNSVILPHASLGEKVQIKSCTIGRNAKIGNRCRLNNVVIMDDVSIGDNCVLQNLVVCTGCTIGENCNLNDCQVMAGVTVPSGTKEKGDSFTT